MPTFQVDHGRAVVVQPVRLPAASFVATGRALAERLDALLGEQLLPVRVRSGEEDEPYLLALDASGQPVVVEVAARLDGTALLGALRHAGRVGRMTLRDLAEAHPDGAERFAADLAIFRESVPFSGTGRSATGVRLLLVCSELAEGMTEVVEALTAAGRGVEVLQAGILDGSDGASLVGVAPVRRDTVEPARHDAAQAERARHGAANAEAPRHDAAHAEPPRHDAAPGPGAAGAPTTPRGIPLVDVLGVPRRVPTGLRPSAPLVPATNGRSALGSEPVSGPQQGRSEPPAAPEALPVTPQALPVVGGPPPGTQDADGGSARHARTAPPQRSSAFGPDARLVELARANGGPVALVWLRRRRDERHEVLLREDGSIELPDGTRVTDPSAAAEIASGAHAPVDGWRMWRVGDADGPALAEVVGGPARR